MGIRLDHLFLAGNPILDYTALPLIRFHHKLQASFVTKSLFPHSASPVAVPPSSTTWALSSKLSRST
jgi:hypothetical protein